MATVAERVEALARPIVEGMRLRLWDVEYTGGVVRVVVDRDGGVDVDTIADVTRLVSRELDHADPVPGRYTLEVSSPGLERSLRTAAHFRASLGAAVAVRTRPHVEGERRIEGTLVAADDDGFEVAPAAGPARRLRYDEAERVRTVFVWGPAEKPVSPSRGGGTARPAKGAPAGAGPAKAGQGGDRTRATGRTA